MRHICCCAPHDELCGDLMTNSVGSVALHAYHHINTIRSQAWLPVPGACRTSSWWQLLCWHQQGRAQVCEHQPHSAAVKMRNSMLMLMLMWLAVLSTAAPGESAQHSSRVQDTRQMQHCRASPGHLVLCRGTRFQPSRCHTPYAQQCRG